jgi:DNA polymerase-3 subunit gamma/tau
VIDRDTAGALTFIEELSERGHDLGRLVMDLLEHLRQLMLVQHLGEVPATLPVTEETRDRLLAQANQMGEATVLRLIDLLAVAVDDMRQGGDPRLPLELALVKVTRPAADLARESVAFRLERLEQGAVPAAPAPAKSAASTADDAPPAPAAAPPAAPNIALTDLQEAWALTVLPAVEERGGIPTASVLREAHPAGLDGDTLTLAFPATAQFQLDLARDPKNATLLADALYDVTGRRLEVAFELGDAPVATAPPAVEEPAGEDEILGIFVDDLGAREREA